MREAVGSPPDPRVAAFVPADELAPIRAPLAAALALGRAALARAASRVRGSRFARWRRSHPGARFSDYYAARVEEKLAGGGSHRTLGGRRWAPEKRAWQRRKLAQLEQFGLKPQHRCVEYGCGSLRIGEHLIRFLNPGRYIGLDVTDRFFVRGLAALGEELVALKRPELHVIEPDLLADLERDPPDFLVSFAVVQHVHPAELDEFLASLTRLIGPTTQAFVSFREWNREIRTAEKSWSRPARELCERIRALDAGLEISVQRGERVPERSDPSRKSLLRIARAPGS
jgi:SAM-dependent methyltransferase